jgi:hypothetical protein
VSYRPGGEPLSQLSYDILTSTHNVNCSSTKTHSIKLNDFSGLVQRIYICAVTNDNHTNKNRYLLAIEMEKVVFESVDTEIYAREHMGFRNVKGVHREQSSVPASGYFERKMVGEKLMDNYLRPSKDLDDPYICYDADSHGAGVVPGSIHVINFKSDWDQRTSASGSLSFGTVHNPTLKITFPPHISDSSIDVIITAELNNLMLYQTNTAGATSIRRITE